MPLIYPNILDCLWCILIYWIVCDVSQFIGCTTTNKPIILRAGLLYMTQFIGWTTTHKPLNLKDWPLYMTQYIWSYSFAAQSKLIKFCSKNYTFSLRNVMILSTLSTFCTLILLHKCIKRICVCWRNLLQTCKSKMLTLSTLMIRV